MDPKIQYAKTEDGVNIAYWKMGKGRRLLISPPMIFSHLTLEWQHPPLRAWYEHLAKDRTVIRWDPRCFGLSERSTPGRIHADPRDVEAVLTKIPGDPCDIVAIGHPGNAAVEYAAAHPNDVADLVIAEPTLRWGWSSEDQLGAITPLIERDETVWSESLARWILGWDSGDLAHAYAQFILASVNHEDVQRELQEMADDNRMSLLPRLTSRTLVISSPMAEWDREHAREVAAAIQGAELLEVQDTTLRGPFMNAEEASAINEFLGLTTEDKGARPDSGGLVIVLFTDMEGSTALTQHLGDAAAQEVRRAHNDIVRSALSANAGSEVKHTGDGIMASFATASAGLDAAIAIQRGVAQHKGSTPDSPLGVYVGLNAGEPIAEDDDLFGTSINLAARICDHAEPGQIVAADVVRQLAAGKDFLFSDLGETELRGFEDPVKLWELRWQVGG